MGILKLKRLQKSSVTEPTENDSKPKQNFLKNIFSKENMGDLLDKVGPQVANIGMEALGSYVNNSDSLTNSSTTIAGMDSVLGSAANATGFGLLYLAAKTGINALSMGLDGMFDKHNGEFYLNQDTASEVGGDYALNMAEFAEAASKSGLKKHWYESTENFDLENRDLTRLNRLAALSRDSKQMAANMHDSFSLGFQNRINGLTTNNWLRAAKIGAKLRYKKNSKLIISKKIGGILETPAWQPNYSELPSWKPTYSEIEAFQDGGQLPNNPRSLEELIEYAKQKNPRFVERFSEPVRSIDYNGLKATHLLGWGSGGPMGAIVYPSVMEDDEGNLKYYDDKNDWEAQKRALEKGDYLDMTPEEARLFTEAPDENSGYKLGWPEFFKQKFKGGGKTESSEDSSEKSNQKSIIPEGALHAHKHHMENDENITKKGIPVVDMNGLQQAEIERDEIIFSLTITNKLEELYKEYYQEDTTLKRKDELAIEAGKIITCEIMTNLEDRTGLVDKCLKGGKLNGD